MEMEHIRQHDWCSSQVDTTFVTEKELDNCVIFRILRNKFHDPLLASESEDESEKVKIDWAEVFKKKIVDGKACLYVPCLQPPPPFPKKSALTSQQHYQMLRVICSENKFVLPSCFMQKPSKNDYKLFEELKPIYEKEQQEFQEWAKTLWTNDHCVRALRPKPDIEMVYEAEFKMKAAEMASLPKRFEMAAQITLDASHDKCEIVHQQDLIKVNISQLPSVQIPNLSKKFTVMIPCAVPEPCTQHPVRFVLPNEKSMSILPLTEVHRELAQFACDAGAGYVAGEGALQCLVETDRHWTLPVSVCRVITTEGEKDIIVFGNEFSVNRESAQTRTYKAFRHLLESAIIPSTERAKLFKDNVYKVERKNKGEKTIVSNDTSVLDNMESSDDEDHLIIADDPFNTMDIDKVTSDTEQEQSQQNKAAETVTNGSNSENDGDGKDHDEYDDTVFETTKLSDSEMNRTESDSDSEMDMILSMLVCTKEADVTECEQSEISRQNGSFEEIVTRRESQSDVECEQLEISRLNGNSFEETATRRESQADDYDSYSSDTLVIAESKLLESKVETNDIESEKDTSESNKELDKTEPVETTFDKLDIDSNKTDEIELDNKLEREENSIGREENRLEREENIIETNKTEPCIAKMDEIEETPQMLGIRRKHAPRLIKPVNKKNIKKEPDIAEADTIEVLPQIRGRRRQAHIPKIVQLDNTKFDEKESDTPDKASDAIEEVPQVRRKKAHTPKRTNKKRGKQKLISPEPDKIEPVIMEPDNTETDITNSGIIVEVTETHKKRKLSTPNIGDKDVKKVKVDANIDQAEKEIENEKSTNEIIHKDIAEDSYYTCTCKESVFKKPPPRSFTKWQVRNNATQEYFDIIVHCAHKCKHKSHEVLLEPVAEYQVDVGASAQSEEKLNSMALSLLLHRRAKMFNVRIDTVSGDAVRADTIYPDSMKRGRTQAAASGLHSALGQLKGLLPGHYLLHHEPSHGSNALLFAPRVTAAGDRQRLSLQFQYLDGAADEAKMLRVPVISTMLLPMHRYRKTLPCAFTPFDNQVAKETKRRSAKTKPPPQAIKWPKKKGRKRKKRNA